MTLHSTAEFFKKGALVSASALGIILLIVMFFKAGVMIKNMMNPPRIEPANQAYGKVPPIPFPQSTIQGDFTYSIETLTGELPTDFPDRLLIYPITTNQASLLDLQNAKHKMERLGFLDDAGIVLPEIQRSGTQFEWRETKDFQRQILYDIVSHNFTMTSNYIYSNTVLRAESKPNEASALGEAQSFLTRIDLLPTDIDIAKTKKPEENNNHNIKPQLLRIEGNDLVPATSLSNTQVVRVDLYQKDIAYKITAGRSGSDLRNFQDFEMNLPILYPRAPYSTMNFLIASGESGNEVVSAMFTHQNINLQPEKEASYPIKSPKEAYDELAQGKGYIASYNGNDSQILIDNVYLAYYLGENPQQYLMPIVVFEGQNGFFGYVQAIKDEAIMTEESSETPEASE